MNEGDSVKSRLIKYLEFKNISKSEFGRTIGVSSAYITSMRKSIQPDKIKAIIESYPDLNTNWLLTGEGEMLNNSEGNVSLLGTAEKAIHENTVSVIFFDINPSATFSELDDAISQSYDTLEVVPLHGERITPEYCIFEIHGDSMTPTLLSHARILCKKIPESKWHYAEGVVVIAYRNKVVVKRIERNDLLGNNCIILTSDNPEYGSETVAQSDIHCMFKAKRIISQDIF